MMARNQNDTKTPQKATILYTYIKRIPTTNIAYQANLQNTTWPLTRLGDSKKIQQVSKQIGTLQSLIPQSKNSRHGIIHSDTNPQIQLIRNNSRLIKLNQAKLSKMVNWRCSRLIRLNSPK